MASERLSEAELIELTGNAWLGTKAQTVAREILELRAENAERRNLIDRIAHWPCAEPAQTSGCTCAPCLIARRNADGAMPVGYCC